MVESRVKDISLSKEGEKELEWARENMPVLKLVSQRFSKEKPFKGLKIGICLHLEKKTGVLLEALAAGGADVSVCSCNPLTTDDRVAAALSEKMRVFAWAGQSNKEYYENLNLVLDDEPNIVIDDGCDQVFALHTSRRELLKNVLGGCEETTTGITRLKAMHADGKLEFPVFSVNDAYSKHLFDNRFGTGQSTLDAIACATNKLFAGKRAVVVGFGWCGRGIADRLRGMGAVVSIVETGSRLGSGPSGFHKALEALYSGYEVLSMEEAIPKGDLFVTATGGKHAISVEQVKQMKNGAMLANAGHFNVEIDVTGLKKAAKSVRAMNPNLERIEFSGGKHVFLLSEGRLVNLSRPAGQGHPIEIMDGSFAIQALCAELLAKNKKYPPEILSVPAEVDDDVARLALEAQGIRLKNLSREQLSYAKEWREGT